MVRFHMKSFWNPEMNPRCDLESIREPPRLIPVSHLSSMLSSSTWETRSIVFTPRALSTGTLYRLRCVTISCEFEIALFPSSGTLRCILVAM